jgi:hypothetical protein
VLPTRQKSLQNPWKIPGGRRCGLFGASDCNDAAAPNPRNLLLVMARSVVSDYASIILRAIESTQNDPARLRQLIYDIARTSLGKQVLEKYAEIGSEGLQQQISDLEAAIRRVEILAQLEADLLPANAQVPLIEGPARPPGHDAMIVSDQRHDDRNVEDTLHDDEIVFAETAPPDIYQNAARAALLPSAHEFLPAGKRVPTRVWDAVLIDPPERRPSRRFIRFGLPIAFLIALAIGTVVFVKSGYAPRFGLLSGGSTAHDAATGAQTSAAPAPASVSPSVTENADVQKLGFPLPSVYGVYAESEGKLYALQPLAIRVPDPRVAISAVISSPSGVTLPSGKIAFVIYRRDLASAAPDSVLVRVVARVARELKFSDAGAPKTIEVKDEWAIRSKSFQFGVAPLKSSPEMIVLHPQDAQLVLPSGRYALTLKGEGYDFSVAGPMTDPVQCLERTNALGGMVYSECPRP